MVPLGANRLFSKSYNKSINDVDLCFHNKSDGYTRGHMFKGLQEIFQAYFTIDI